MLRNRLVHLDVQDGQPRPGAVDDIVRFLASIFPDMTLGSISAYKGAASLPTRGTRIVKRLGMMLPIKFGGRHVGLYHRRSAATLWGSDKCSRPLTVVTDNVFDICSVPRR